MALSTPGRKLIMVAQAFDAVAPPEFAGRGEMGSGGWGEESGHGEGGGSWEDSSQVLSNLVAGLEALSSEGSRGVESGAGDVLGSAGGTEACDGIDVVGGEGGQCSVREGMVGVEAGGGCSVGSDREEREESGGGIEASSGGMQDLIQRCLRFNPKL